MAANNVPIVPISPVVGIGDTVATLTARTKITGTTGLTQVTPTSTNGKRIDRIVVHVAANSAAASILLFIYNGTTSFLFDEIPVAAVTAGNTTPAFHAEKSYTNLVLPATYQIYAATTIAQNTDVFAFGGDY